MMIEPTTDNDSPEDDPTNLVPAHVIAQKRRQRDERRKLMASTMAADGQAEETVRS